MSSTIIPKARRSRGRPRKSFAGINNVRNIPANLNPTPQFTHKRKQTFESASDEIQIIALNGMENLQSKKLKLDDLSDPNLPKRLLPHRAARFTESYGGTSPDVVVISDEEGRDEESDSDSDSECGPIPSPVVVVRSKEEQEEYEEKMQHLKKLLSDEEMKLVLLKKLQDSQKTKDSKREAANSPVPTASTAQTTQKSAAFNIKSGVQIQPLPSKQLLSNNSRASLKKQEMKIESISQIGKSSSSSTNLPLSKHAVKAELNNSAVSTVSSSSAEKINSTHLQQYPLLKNLSAQITITAVPPVGKPVATSNHSQSSISITTKQSRTNIATPPLPVQKEKSSESLIQQQAAAKLNLRKQLEQTLLQIPLPKPPPLKINFFPNVNSIEFLCLVGLDFVVDFLTKSNKKQPQTTPLRCSQCSTDFTCAWKWKEVEKNGVKSFDSFCEACINTNVRKSLKAQHTNSLKAAFLKALHQEKEIDKMTSPVPSSATKSRSSTPTTVRSTSSAPRLPSPAPAHQNNSPAAILPLPKHAHPMAYIPKMSHNMNHAAALAQMSKLSPQYQSLLQFQAQHLLATGVPLHPSMLASFMTPNPNHSRGKSNMVQNDLRRQYRSDRVQSPSLPHSSSWKA